MLSGIYRGVITGAVDPTGLNRLYVSIPVLTGSHSVWAFPCLTGPLPTVKPGDGVWVMFEGGDLAYPVWMGFFGGATLTHTHPSVSDFFWNYDSASTMANPGTGKIRTNTAAGTPSTQVALSDLTARGMDASQTFESLAVGDVIHFQQTNNAANWGRYHVATLPVDNGTWWQIGITVSVQHGTPIAKNQEVLVRFTYD